MFSLPSWGNIFKSFSFSAQMVFPKYGSILKVLNKDHPNLDVQFTLEEILCQYTVLNTRSSKSWGCEVTRLNNFFENLRIFLFLNAKQERKKTFFLGPFLQNSWKFYGFLWHFRPIPLSKIVILTIWLRKRIHF